MDIKQLEYFRMVAEAGTLSRAAVLLAVTQPVVSRYIRALEAELGVELFYRNGRGIVLTDAGLRLKEHAVEILDNVARARTDIMGFGSTPSGKLVIGVPPSVGTVLTLPLVRSFKTEFPRVALKVVEGFSGHVREWLATGRIDVAVLYDATGHASLNAEPLLEDELFLLGPISDPAGVGDGPVSARRLAEIPLILPSQPHGLRVLLDTELARIGVEANVDLELEAMPSAISLVEAGIGYTILPYAAVHKMVSAGRIRCWSITEPTMTRALILVTSTQRPMTIATRALVKIVRRQVRELVAGGQWMPIRSDGRAVGGG